MTHEEYRFTVRVNEKGTLYTIEDERVRGKPYIAGRDRVDDSRHAMAIRITEAILDLNRRFHHKRDTSQS